MGKSLIFIGAVFIVVGIIIQVGARWGLGNLPGDITLKWDRSIVKIPLMSCFMLSMMVSLFLWIWRFFRQH